MATRAKPLGLFHPTPKEMAEMQILVPLFVLPCHRAVCHRRLAARDDTTGVAVRVEAGGRCRSSLEKDRSSLFDRSVRRPLLVGGRSSPHNASELAGWEHADERGWRQSSHVTSRQRQALDVRAADIPVARTEPGWCIGVPVTRLSSVIPETFTSHPGGNAPCQPESEARASRVRDGAGSGRAAGVCSGRPGALGIGGIRHDDARAEPRQCKSLGPPGPIAALALALVYGGPRNCSPACGSSPARTRSAPSPSPPTGPSGSRTTCSGSSSRAGFRGRCGRKRWASSCLGWTIFTVYLTIASLRVSAAVAGRVRRADDHLRASDHRRLPESDCTVTQCGRLGRRSSRRPRVLRLGRPG